MIRSALVFAALLFFTDLASAQTIGTIRYDQQGYGYYYYGDSIWLYGPSKYTCTGYVAGTTSYYNCRYYTTPSYYTFAPYVAATPSLAYSKNWRADHARILELQTKYDGDFREAEADRADYQKSLDKLGVQRGPWGGYVVPRLGIGVGVGLGYGGITNGLLTNTTMITSGNTLYGTPTVAQISDLYNTNDPALLYQQANALAQQSIAAGSKAAGDFGDLVGKEGANRYQLARLILAQQLASQVLKNSELPPKTTSTTQTFKFGTGGNGLAAGQEPQLEELPLPKKAAATTWLLVAKNKCVSCHAADADGNPPPGGFGGGFDLNKYDHSDLAQRKRVTDRLTTADPTKLMPRDVTGKGVRLSDAEIKVWLKD